MTEPKIDYSVVIPTIGRANLAELVAAVDQRQPQPASSSPMTGLIPLRRSTFRQRLHRWSSCAATGMARCRAECRLASHRVGMGGVSRRRREHTGGLVRPVGP